MINSRSIYDLHPTVRRAAEELQRRLAEYGWEMGVSATYRDFEYQDYLYEQGRSRPGGIVTNARGGESIHNYRLAFDIYNNQAGNLYPDEFMQLAGEIGEKMGLEWGGSWISFVDMPHFQFTNGLTLTDLQEGEMVPSDTKMKWEADSEDGGDREGDEMPIYNTLPEVPTWGQDTISKLIDKGVLFGDERGLQLTDEMVRIFVVLDRLELF